MLFVNLLLIGGIMLAAQWRFTQSLRNYVQQEEVQRAEALTQELAQLYARNQSWEILRQRPGRWLALLRHSSLPHDNPQDSTLAPSTAPRIPAHRLLLLDAQGQVIIGNQDLLPQVQRLPIVHEQQTVGWLGIAPPRLRGDALRDRLLREQAQGLLWIGLLALLLAGLASIALARHFLQPIRRLNSAAQGLAQGDLSQRLALQRTDEFGQLAGQFDRMAEALQHQEQNRRAWLADVSHELRTPLSILKGEIEALQDGLRPLDQHALASLHEESQRLSHLVDDLYQLTQADAGTMNYAMQPLDFSALAQAAAERFHARFQQAGLSFSLS